MSFEKPIPTKFTFTNGNSRLLKLTNINGDYYCTLPHVEADTVSSAVYDRINVEHKLHTGKWKIEEDLSEPEKGPEMKFPFTVKDTRDNDTYYVYKDSCGDVHMSDEENSWHTDLPNLYAEEDMKKFIKDGTWLVQSVGEQEAKEGPTKMSVGSLSNISTGISNLTIKFDCEADEAIAKMERLAQAVEAVEAVTIAFESLESVMEGLGMGGKVVEDIDVCAKPFDFKVN